MTVSIDQVWHPWQNNQAGTGQAAGVWRRNNGHKRQCTYIRQTPDDDWREGKHPRRWETDQNPLGYHEHVKERQSTIMSALIRPLTLIFFFFLPGYLPGRLQVTDRDQAETPNSKITVNLISQEPKEPKITVMQLYETQAQLVLKSGCFDYDVSLCRWVLHTHPHTHTRLKC